MKQNKVRRALLFTVSLLALGSFALAVEHSAAQQDNRPSRWNSMGLPAPPVAPLPPVVGPGPPGTDIELGGTNEPTIAINPLDPDNIAMASLYASRVSTDGGATWTAETKMTSPYLTGSGGDPSLAFDSQGRLFWSYLVRAFLPTSPPMLFTIHVVELDPTTGVIIAGPFIPTIPPSPLFDDKEWLAADSNPGSPFRDRLYLVWTRFFIVPLVLTSYSDDHGQTWSAPLEVSHVSEVFVWPPHVAVAPNGDVYVAYHSQPSLSSGVPDGVSGQIIVLRSIDGGATFPQKTVAYAPGEADITRNVQHLGGTIPKTDFWLLGSVQPWILPDPLTPGNVYVVANDDSDDVHGTGDDADVYIARSTNHGATWGQPILVESGPGESFQVMPTAAIDRDTGTIAVTWFDNRNGAMDPDGNYLLDLFYSVSADQGLTFTTPIQLSDAPFDTDLGAFPRFFGPPPTYRIGEYNGVAIADCTIHAVWCGNKGTHQQTLYDNAPVAVSPSTLVYGCGVNPAGSMLVLSGLPAIGSTVVLGLDNPLGTQAAGSLPFMGLALAPFDASLFPCGVQLPGFGMAAPGASGELLISIAPPDPFATIAGPPWAGPGSPAAMPLPVPDNCNLIGLPVYAQGLIVDPTPGALVPFGLTDAVELRIGL